MNNELSAESDLRNMITVDISETMTPEIELTDAELEAADDIRFSDEMAATVAELPVFTDEQNSRYNHMQSYQKQHILDIVHRFLEHYYHQVEQYPFQLPLQ